MKKVVAILAVVMFAFAGFASASQTKLMSQANLPAVLTLDNPVVGNTYISRLGEFANLLTLEAGLSGTWGYAVLDIGPGVLGLSSSPLLPQLTSVGLDRPSNLFGAQYIHNLEGTAIGIGVLYGLDTDSYTNTDPETAPFGTAGPNGDADETTFSESCIAILLGATLDVGMPLDVGVSVVLGSENDEYTDLNNADSDIDSFDSDIASSLGVGVAGRVIIDGSNIANLSVAFESATSERINQDDNDADGDFDSVGDVDTIDNQTDSGLGVTLLYGKILKATETLLVTIGAGVNYSSSKSTLTEHIDNNTSALDSFGPLNVYSNTNISIPLNFAVEGRLDETWAIRGGTSQNVVLYSSQLQEFNDDITDDSVEEAATSSSLNIDQSLNVAIGLQATVGDLVLEFDLNPMILIAGPDFLTGSAMGIWAWQVAVNYVWGK